MKRALVIGSVAASCFLGLMLLELRRPLPYEQARHFLHDTIARAGRTTPANLDLVFLAIDSDSAGLEETGDVEELYGLTDPNSEEARALRLMSQRWPWPREVYGMVLDRLVRAGAKVVLFDLTFPSPTDGDEPFRLSLERNHEHVVLGSNFVSSSSRGFSTIAASHTRPPDSLVPQTTPMDNRVGYTNFWPDQDDVVRSAQYRITFEQVQGTPPAADSERYLSLAGRGLTKAGYASVVPEGLSDHLFRYTARPRLGFPSRSIFEIFVPDYWKQNYGNGEFFRGKIVLIGAEGNWQHDEHPTPFGSMPGPEIHLNAINAALHREFLRELPLLAVAALTLFAAGGAIWLTLAIRSPWLRLLCLALADGGAAWLALILFNHASLYLPLLAPLTQFNLCILFGLISDLTLERVEKNRVRRTLEKYVSTNVVRELLDHPAEFQHSLGGVIKPAAILFSDIRGFTAISAKTDPHALVSQLNEYFHAMVECVFRHGGTLDKFIGDALMAVWGNVHTEGVRNDTANAVRAALAMRAELAGLNENWRKRGLQEFRIGIAVNQGDVIVGNIGSARRMEFTVIGDVVNVSWKLQEVTKQFAADLIVSKNVTALLVEDFELQPLGEATIAGHAEPFEVFSVLGAVEVTPYLDRVTLASLPS